MPHFSAVASLCDPDLCACPKSTLDPPSARLDQGPGGECHCTAAAHGRSTCSLAQDSVASGQMHCGVDHHWLVAGYVAFNVVYTIVEYVSMTVRMQCRAGCLWYLLSGPTLSSDLSLAAVCSADIGLLRCALARCLYLTFNVVKILPPYEYLTFSECQYGLLLVVIMMRCTINTAFVATFQSLQRQDSEESQQQVVADQLRSFMHHRRLPRELQDRIVDQASFAWSRSRGLDDAAALEGLPAPLATDICMFFHHELLGRTSLFQRADASLLRAISTVLRARVFMPDDHITRAGDRASELFILKFGRVLEEWEDTRRGLIRVHEICDGEILGDDALPTNMVTVNGVDTVSKPSDHRSSVAGLWQAASLPVPPPLWRNGTADQDLTGSLLCSPGAGASVKGGTDVAPAVQSQRSSAAQLRESTLIALDFCDVLVLSVRDWFDVLAYFPEQSLQLTEKLKLYRAKFKLKSVCLDPLRLFDPSKPWTDWDADCSPVPLSFMTYVRVSSLLLHSSMPDHCLLICYDQL